MKLNILTVIILSICAIGTTSLNAGKVFHVNIEAVNASDKNPGTEKEPWKTLTHAGKSAKAGDNVIIHPGTYHQSLRIEQSGTKENPITFSGTELGKVILDGSVKVANWKRSAENPAIWVTENKLKLRKYPRKHVYSKYYNTSDPRDLDMDGRPLFFTHKKNLLPGSWTSDKKQNLLFARLPDDSDPNLHEMRVIELMCGVDTQTKIKPKYINVSNLHIKRFQCGIRVWSPYSIVENNIIEWSENWGLFYNASAHDSIFRNNIIRWNGHMGTNGGHRIKVINNKILFSNWKLSSPGWDASAIKSCMALDVLYKGNECAYSGSLGIWLDINNQGVVIEDNIVHDNYSAGLEDEVSFGNTWKNNVSYRNGTGFYVGNCSNNIIEGNIFADNRVGMSFRFARKRKDNLPKPSNPNSVGQCIKNISRHNSPERIQAWLDDFLKYAFPCRMVRDNTIKNNILLNNGFEINNRMTKNLPDPTEKYLIDNNTFTDNIIINKDPSKVISNYRDFDEYLKRNPKSVNCQYFKKLEIEKLPAWAATLYKRHMKRLNYPRSYSSLRSIRSSLLLRNPECSNYPPGPTPAGLLALARICESETLEKISFSDKGLYAYNINYNGKSTIVLWRKHGRPTDFLPVLLKGVPENATLETSWGTKIPIQRKGDIASINVGTWPIYLRDCSKSITEVQPFKVSIIGELGKDNKIEIKLTECIANGKLHIDSFNDKITHTRELVISDGTAVIPLNIPSDVEMASIRIAGTLNGLYSGKMLSLMEKVSSKNTIIDAKGFTSIPITKFGNCSLSEGNKLPELLQISLSSLTNIPETLKLGNITFKTDKDSCIGLASIRTKDKRPAAVTIPLGGKKYKALAFLHVLAYAPKEKGVDLIDYTLNYGDNFTASATMKNGMHLMDWWNDPEGKLNPQKHNSYLAWAGDGGNGHTVHVYAYIWENPNPEKELRSVTIGGGDLEKKTTLGVLAISGLNK